MTPCILALDCSLRRTNIAVYNSEKLLASHQSELGRHQAAELPLIIEALLRKSSISFENLNLIAVTNGPGYFTGIRVGAAYAMALAFGLGIRIIPISTLVMLAYPYIKEQSPVLATLYAGREHVYAASFACSQELPPGEYKRETLENWLKLNPCTVISDDPEKVSSSVSLSVPVLQVTPNPEALIFTVLKELNQQISPLNLTISYYRDPDLGKPKLI